MADALMRRAAERAAQDRFFLASALLPYAREEGFDDHALAERLGCAVDDLPRVLLCRRPASEPAAFRADVERIAAAFGLELATLAGVVRLAEAAEAVRQVGLADAGWLAAARDREPESDPENRE